MERSTEQLRISRRGPGDYTLEGHLDLATIPLLGPLVDEPGPIRLDLAGVTFIDSSGVGALMRLYLRGEVDGRSLRVENCSAQVERTLKLVDLYDYLAAPDEAETVECAS